MNEPQSSDETGPVNLPASAMHDAETSTQDEAHSSDLKPTDIPKDEEEETHAPGDATVDVGHAGQAQGSAQYSNEARVYHARYAELSQAHDEGRYDYCREGSLDMLMEPRVPRYTRVQILQMVSTLLSPAGAKSCLQEANSILMDGDPESRATQLLLDDNQKMWRDLYERYGEALESDGDDDEEAGEAEMADNGETEDEVEGAGQ